MNTTELLHILALQKATNIGDITAKKLIRHCGTAEAVFLEKSALLQKIPGIGSFVTSALSHSKAWYAAAEKELTYMEKNHIKHWYFEEDNYPSRLKNCVDGPLLLFHSGNINLDKQKIISVVGSRKITNYGRHFCEKLITDLSILDPVIVSGFAYGTDITAHLSAIKNNLQTIGCFAHGLNQVYPKAHKQYVNAVMKNGGFITEFWSTSSPERENFVKRNRVIAGLSEATLVIESAEKGGSLITADLANSYNREVFAVPGRPEDPLSAGTNTLIKLQRAQLISTAADIIYLLNWSPEKTAKKLIQPQLFVDLNDTESQIVAQLKKAPKIHLDALCLLCQLPIHQVSSTLLSLELKGLVRPHPGKHFELIGA